MSRHCPSSYQGPPPPIKAVCRIRSQFFSKLIRHNLPLRNSVTEKNNTTLFSCMKIHHLTFTELCARRINYPLTNTTHIICSIIRLGCNIGSITPRPSKFQCRSYPSSLQVWYNSYTDCIYEYCMKSVGLATAAWC